MTLLMEKDDGTDMADKGVGVKVENVISELRANKTFPKQNK